MLDSIKPRKNWQQVRHQTVWEKPRSWLRLGLAALMLLFLVVGIFAGIKVVTLAEKIIEGGSGRFSFGDLFMGADRELRGETDGVIRVLLLGIGGEGHDGPNLTDTIILATIELPEKKTDQAKIGLVSIPRDLLADIPGQGFRKINSAHALGQLGGKNDGAMLVRQTVEKILDTPVPYYGLVDFKGFERIVDDLGGLDIQVDRGFTDSLFPDDRTAGYLPPVSFEPGRQHMDGRRALQFVRSRHGGNGEGTDFARSRRQAKVLNELKEKIQNLNFVTNLGLVNRLLDDLSDHLRTNLQPYEIKRLYDLVKDVKSQHISSLAIDLESGLVCSQIEEVTQAYILLPCAGLGKYEAVRQYVNNQFAANTLSTEQASVEIQNASKIDLLGQQLKSRLAPGLASSQINVANFQGDAVYQESVIYDNTRGVKPATLQYLQTSLGVRTAQSPFPFPTSATRPDFVIIVASDLKK